jgi:hypothetical protein
MLPETDATSRVKGFLDMALQLDPEPADGWAGLCLYHVVTRDNSSLWLYNSKSAAGDMKGALRLIEDITSRDPLS